MRVWNENREKITNNKMNSININNLSSHCTLYN